MSSVPRATGRQSSVTIFIPSDENKYKCERNPLMYGWALSTDEDERSIIILIAGFISPSDAKRNDLQTCNSLIGPSRACIVGKLVKDVSIERKRSMDNTTQEIHSKEKEASVWVEIGKSKVIQLRSPINADSMTCSITTIRYRIPLPAQMQYVSLEPMSLPLASSAEFLISANENSDKLKEAVQQDRLERLVMLDPKRFQDLSRDYAMGKAPGEGLRIAVDLINRVAYLRQSIKQKGEGRSNGSLKKHSSSHLRQIWQIPKAFITFIRPVFTKRVRPELPSLVEFSACARQLNLRLGQALIWPTLGHRLRSHRKREQQPVSQSGPQYTALYNGVWLVANDLILGQAIGLLLCDHRFQLASKLQTFIQPVFITSITESLHFLDNWPLGVKLNTPLSRFFCDMYTGMTEIWSEQVLSIFTMNGTQALSSIIYSIGMATRLFGFSMMLCVFIDLFNLITFHLTVFYQIQWRMYAFFCSSITSLFYLFRGKKRNPLRKMRVDHATYDLDQLLLGTIFFTILVFLWLTVATYYALFSCIRLINVSIVALLQTFLATINHLPLFALMLRIKDPARLPGGLALKTREQEEELESEKHLPSTDFDLQNVPLGLSDIFRGQHRHLENLLGLPRLTLHVLIGKKI